jgi:hypothetical protein
MKELVSKLSISGMFPGCEKRGRVPRGGKKSCLQIDHSAHTEEEEEKTRPSSEQEKMVLMCIERDVRTYL